METMRHWGSITSLTHTIDVICISTFTTVLMIPLPNNFGERERDRLFRVGLSKGRFTSYEEIRLHFPTQSAMFLSRSRNHKIPSSFGLVLVCHGAVYNETQCNVRVPRESGGKEYLAQGDVG